MTKNEVAIMYSVPPKHALRVEKVYCHGNTEHYTYILETTQGKGWQGCGHPSCTACEFEGARGVVGDNAIRMFENTWREMLVHGENVPRYVEQCLTSNTFVETRGCDNA